MPDMDVSYSEVAEKVNAASVRVLRATMDAHGITQRKIAANLGLSYVTVNRYLKEVRDVPLSLVFAVAEAAKMPASELVERIGREMADPLI